MAEIVSSSEFDEKVLKSQKPVLVDFFATWCGPCKVMAPYIDELSEELAGQVDVYKVDVDQSMDIARRYKVMSVPTVIVFQDGEPKKQTIGAQPKANLLDLLH